MKRKKHIYTRIEMIKFKEFNVVESDGYCDNMSSNDNIMFVSENVSIIYSD